MYENGKRLNRYARKQRHRKTLMKRSTPIQYSSYIKYVEDAWLKDALIASQYPHSKLYKFIFEEDSTGLNYDKWWRGYTGIVNRRWKKIMKQAEHRKQRAYYRDRLRYATLDPEHDFKTGRWKAEDCWTYY